MPADRHPFARVLPLLAVLALALAAILDVGLMPARDGSGQQILVLCSGQGPMQMVVDPATGKLRPAAPSRARAMGCDWAGAQTCAAPAGPVTSVAITLATTAAIAFPDEIVWRGARKVSAVRARGPPVAM